MPAGSTYTPISTTTLGSAQSSVTLSSIPSTYTDLFLTCSLRATAATFNATNYIEPTFNGNTSALYSLTSFFRRTGTITNASNSNANNLRGVAGIATPDLASGIFTHFTMNIMNYANTSINKTALCTSRTGGNLSAMDDVWTAAGLWRNTAAITSITFLPSAGNFETGCTFTLYGIAAA
jgi:hypothetical protein